MKFALVIIETPSSREHIQKNRADHRQKIQQWMNQVAASGQLVGGEAFETESMPPVTLRISASGRRERTSVGFAGSHETLGGYFIIEAKDHEEAILLASSWPTEETIEIRPLWVPN